MSFMLNKLTTSRTIFLAPNILIFKRLSKKETDKNEQNTAVELSGVDWFYEY